MSWRCQHGREICRSCNFGLDGLASQRPAKGDQMAYAILVNEIAHDLNRGDAIVLRQDDFMAALLPAGVSLTMNDVHNARHNLPRAIEAGEL